jgi:hypothetical protein
VKVARLKQGYRIHLTDAEFEALRLLYHQGCGELMNFDDDELRSTLSPAAYQAITDGRLGHDGAFIVDDDRRRTGR